MAISDARYGRADVSADKVSDSDEDAESVAASSPIDVQILLSRAMGNLSFAQMLLDEFERSGQEQVENIVRCVEANSCGQAAEMAHSLKGAAAIIGAEGLREKAMLIEHSVRNGQPSGILELVRDLRSEMERCVACLTTVRTLIAEKSTSSV